MNQAMRWMAVPAMVATVLAAGATVVRAETNADAAGAAMGTPPAPAAQAPKAGTSAKQTSQPHHIQSKPMPSPHRKAEAGMLKITNKQARMFTLECETCAPETKDQVYKAPPAMNLHALDGKRVRVTFDTTGKVQSIHRIDAHRHVTTGKKQA